MESTNQRVIVTSEEFFDARRVRARHGIEWMCAVVRMTGIAIPESWKVQEWAQFPYWPLNVAGWPDRWLSSSSLYARAAFLAAEHLRVPQFEGDNVDAAFAHCGIYDISKSSRLAVADVWNRTDGEAAAVVRAVLATPEFALA